MHIKPEFFKKNIYLIFLLFLFFLSSINSIYLIHKDKQILHIDNYNYYLKSLNLYYSFIGDSRETRAFSWHFFNEPPLRKPPFFMLSSLPLYFLFGAGTDIARLTNLFYLGILVFSSYFLGSSLYSKKTGFMSSSLLLIIPEIYSISRSYMPDLAMVSLIMITILTFIKSRCFADRKHSIIFGVAFAIGMMIRWTFIIFVFPWIFFEIYDKRKLLMKKKKKFLVNILLSVLVSLPIFLPWYVANINGIISDFLPMATGKNLAIPPEKMTFYLELLYSFSFGKLIFPIIAFLSLHFLFFSKTKYKLPLILSILFPLLFFSLLHNKTSHYILGIIPFIVLISSISLNSIKFFKIRWGITFLLFFLGTMQMFIAQTNQYTSLITNPHEGIFIFHSSEEFEFYQIVDFFNKTKSNKSDEVLFINFVPLSSLEYIFYIEKIPLYVEFPLELFAGKFANKLDFDSYLDKADFVVYFAGIIEDEPSLRKAEQEFIKAFLERKSEFRVIARFYSAYLNSEYEIYRRIA